MKNRKKNIISNKRNVQDEIGESNRVNNLTQQTRLIQSCFETKWKFAQFLLLLLLCLFCFLHCFLNYGSGKPKSVQPDLCNSTAYLRLVLFRFPFHHPQFFFCFKEMLIFLCVLCRYCDNNKTTVSTQL